MLNSGLFTSASGDWETPQHVFDELDKEFGFTLDACATTDNAKCANFIIFLPFLAEWGIFVDRPVSRRGKGTIVSVSERPPLVIEGSGG